MDIYHIKNRFYLFNFFFQILLLIFILLLLLLCYINIPMILFHHIFGRLIFFKVGLLQFLIFFF